MNKYRAKSNVIAVLLLAQSLCIGVYTELDAAKRTTKKNASKNANINTDTTTDVIEIQTTDQFMEIINGPVPVVVKHYLTTCPHCKAIKKPHADIAAQYDHNDVIFIAIDETHEDLEQRHNIEQYPTFVYILNGKVVETQEGAAPGNIASKINGAIKKYFKVSPKQDNNDTAKKTTKKNVNKNTKMSTGTNDDTDTTTNIVEIKPSDQGGTAQFNKLITGPTPVVIKFYSAQDPNCQKIKKPHAQLAAQYDPNDVIFIAVESPSHKDLEASYHIEQYPTFFYMNNGYKVETQEGVTPEEITEQVSEAINRNFGVSPK